MASRCEIEVTQDEEEEDLAFWICGLWFWTRDWECRGCWWYKMRKSRIWDRQFGLEHVMHGMQGVCLDRDIDTSSSNIIFISSAMDSLHRIMNRTIRVPSFCCIAASLVCLVVDDVVSCHFLIHRLTSMALLSHCFEYG